MCAAAALHSTATAEHRTPDHWALRGSWPWGSQWSAELHQVPHLGADDAAPPGQHWGWCHHRAPAVPAAEQLRTDTSPRRAEHQGKLKLSHVSNINGIQLRSMFIVLWVIQLYLLVSISKLSDFLYL